MPPQPPPKITLRRPTGEDDRRAPEIVYTSSDRLSSSRRIPAAYTSGSGYSSPSRYTAPGYASSGFNSASGHTSPSRYSPIRIAPANYTDNRTSTIHAARYRASPVPRALSASTAARLPTSSTGGIATGNNTTAGNSINQFEYTMEPTAASASRLTWIKLKQGASMTPVEFALLNNLGVLMARLDELKLLVEGVIEEHKDGEHSHGEE